MRALLDKATSYIRLLWELKLQKDPSIIMVALFLTNYLNDISCFTSFDLLIENSFLFILLPVLV